MNENSDIMEINENQFEEKVLKASSDHLILVDFWAPWCGPCKQLTPLLEKIISNSDGKVKLIKINIDENQQIASQLQIQSIPAVFAFKDSKPVDAFQGVIPETKIIEFIEKSLGEKLNEDFTEFYMNISKLISNHDYKEAKGLLEVFLSENPAEFKSYGMYLDCLTHLELFQEADSFSDSLNEEAKLNDHIKSSLQRLKIKKKNNEGPSVEDLLNKINKNPKDIVTIIQLSEKYFANNEPDKTFELLLSNYYKNVAQIKPKFLEFFEALGNDHEKTKEYRKKLSSLMFS